MPILHGSQIRSISGPTGPVHWFRMHRSVQQTLLGVRPDRTPELPDSGSRYTAGLGYEHQPALIRKSSSRESADPHEQWFLV